MKLFPGSFQQLKTFSCFHRFLSPHYIPLSGTSDNCACSPRIPRRSEQPSQIRSQLGRILQTGTLPHYTQDILDCCLLFYEHLILSSKQLFVTAWILTCVISYRNTWQTHDRSRLFCDNNNHVWFDKHTCTRLRFILRTGRERPGSTRFSKFQNFFYQLIALDFIFTFFYTILTIFM